MKLAHTLKIYLARGLSPYLIVTTNGLAVRPPLPDGAAFTVTTVYTYFGDGKDLGTLVRVRSRSALAGR